MGRIPVQLLLLMILSFNESEQRANKDSATYKAATVEYKPVVYKNDPGRTLRENAEEYRKMINSAAVEEDTDIIVFPEFGLTSLDLPNKSELYNWSTLVPDPEQNFKPCRDTTDAVSEVLKKIACHAERSTIFVVVNVIEREKCSGTDCPSYGYYYYSTNVVFHQSGALIARYRRSYPTDELPQLDLPKELKVSTFDTTFGVTFANVIGMDILYEEPLRSLLEDHKITDVVYTAAWYNVMPFETAIQIQSGWSYAKNVTLLAAGLNDVEKGYSGSGIYAGTQKTLKSTLGKTGNQQLLGNVSKKRNAIYVGSTSHDHGHLRHDELRRSIRYQDGRMAQEDLDEFKSKPITQKGTTQLVLIDNGLTCEFHVDVSNLSPSETYHFVAHDTGAAVGNETVRGTRICAIIQCADANSLRSCSGAKSSTTNFNYAKITASYIDNGRTFMMPNTLATRTSVLEPIDDFTFEESLDGRQTVKAIILTEPTQNLVTFGIWGRNFATDVSNIAPSSNFHAIFWPLFIIFVLIVLFISYRFKDRIAELWQRLREQLSKTSIENDTLRRPDMHPRSNGDSSAPLREGL